MRSCRTVSSYADICRGFRDHLTVNYGLAIDEEDASFHAEIQAAIQAAEEAIEARESLKDSIGSSKMRIYKRFEKLGLRLPRLQKEAKAIEMQIGTKGLEGKRSRALTMLVTVSNSFFFFFFFFFFWLGLQPRTSRAGGTTLSEFSTF